MTRFHQRLLALCIPLLVLLGTSCRPVTAEVGPAQSSSATLSVDFLDVGQGDAILVRSPEGKAMLVDAGPSRAVVDRLRERGVESIDLLVLSHHHFDHFGGMEAVLRIYKPKYLIATSSTRATPSYVRFLKAIRDSGITVLRPAAEPRKIELGSVQVTVLPQPPHNPDEENNNSIGLRVQYGKFAVLMTGDSEDAERLWWCQNCPDLLRDCTVLKLAHHGSHNGTDPTWLSLVRPRLAVVSLAAGNTFGHPHSETLTLLARYSIPLLRTDQQGTINIRSDGQRWRSRGTELASRGPTSPARASSSRTRARSDERIDLNTASAAELENVPGIGPATARRIIEARPFRTVDDLRQIRGLGEARLAEIRPRVVIR